MTVFSLPFRRCRWADCTSIKAGLGQLKIYSPYTEKDLLCFLESRENTPIFPIGNGTNLIGSDQDNVCNAISLCGEFSELRQLDAGSFLAGAGCRLPLILRQMARAGWGGAAALSGIPGTLGGALRMNAGALGTDISQFIETMEGINSSTGEKWKWRRKDDGWTYRGSPVPSKVLLLRAVIQMKECGIPEESRAIQDEQQRRKKVTPSGLSAGSVFRNPQGFSAGKLLEDAGCKGMRCNAFQVSHQHANWIINTSGHAASANDCMHLVKMMQEKVLEKFNILLQTEWQTADALFA